MVAIVLTSPQMQTGGRSVMGQSHCFGDMPVLQPPLRLSACRTPVQGMHYWPLLVEVMGIESGEKYLGRARTVQEPETKSKPRREFRGGIFRMAIP